MGIICNETPQEQLERILSRMERTLKYLNKDLEETQKLLNNYKWIKKCSQDNKERCDDFD